MVRARVYELNLIGNKHKTEEHHHPTNLLTHNLINITILLIDNLPSFGFHMVIPYNLTFSLTYSLMSLQPYKLFSLLHHNSFTQLRSRPPFYDTLHTCVYAI